MVAKEEPTLKGIFFALLAHKNQNNLNGKQSESCPRTKNDQYTKNLRVKWIVVPFLTTKSQIKIRKQYFEISIDLYTLKSQKSWLFNSALLYTFFFVVAVQWVVSREFLLLLL